MTDQGFQRGTRKPRFLGDDRSDTLPPVLVYCGIDEAGYGPLLGPLCVATTAFVVADHNPASGAPDLWSLLSAGVCRKTTDRRRRVAVDDSKKLKGAADGAAHPLRHLERGVLSFAGLEGDIPPTDAALFARLEASVTTAVPWYAGASALPVAHAADELGIAAAQLRRAARTAGVSCAMLRCEAIDAAPFNERLAMTRNKATVNFDAVVRHIERIWRSFPQEHPRVVVDRQGGRTGYRGPLALCFPDAEIVVLAETERVSRYRLMRDGSTITLSFETESEVAHLPVALASMIAKYTRELWMLRLNRWFGAQRPGVRPTAGYVQDGRRWLDEMAPVLAELAIDRGSLVRNG